MRNFIIGDKVRIGIDSGGFWPNDVNTPPNKYIDGVVIECDIIVFRVCTTAGAEWLYYQPNDERCTFYNGYPELMDNVVAKGLPVYKEELRYYTSQGIPSAIKTQAEERAKSWIRRNVAIWPFHKILKADTTVASLSDSESVITFNWYWTEDPAEQHPKSI